MADSNPYNRSSRRRLAVLAGILVVVFGIYCVRLFQIQIVEGEYYASQANRLTETKVSIAASRGEILDRYLRPMAVNRTSFSLVIDGAFFPRGSGAEARNKQNTILLKLAALLESRGEEWNDTLPITKTEPFQFMEDQESAVATLRKKLGLADYATVENCMAALIESYALEDYAPAEQRRLAGIQYEMAIRDFSLKNPFVFCNDISRDTAYIIKENNTAYPGVTPQATPVREYVSGTIAPHLIGTIGPIYPEEYESLKDKGYQLNDILGKSGIEQAMESSLRGTTGTRVLVRDASGAIVDEYESAAAVAGNSVVLTLDKNLQKTTEDLIMAKMAEMRLMQPTATKKWRGQDIRSGSVVLLDVKTGGVLVSASVPGYDLSTYSSEYANLLNDPEKPLFNRALYGTFACGSTIKPAIAIAGLSEGVITSDQKGPSCDGVYHYYENVGFAPRCTGHHGSLNVVGALQKSCNVFFFDLGRRLTIKPMNSYLTRFGFGVKTGIEIGEAAGVLAGPDTKSDWVEGDTIQVAIGQLTNRFTPIQLAAYAMQLANGGVRYKTHLVHSVRSYDGTVETVVEPEVADRLDIDPAILQTVREGMVAVTKNGGTAVSSFRDASYTVAAKTGTAQNGNGDRSDHGVFIAYAPAENPEVAISVVMENGTSTPAHQVARQVLDAYFASKSTGTAPTPEQQLLP